MPAPFLKSEPMGQNVSAYFAQSSIRDPSNKNGDIDIKIGIGKFRSST